METKDYNYMEEFIMEKAFNLVKLVGSALVGLGGLIIAILGIKKEIKPAAVTETATPEAKPEAPAPETKTEQ